MTHNGCNAGSQAETYIEECFEQKCFQKKDFEKVINQWRSDKKQFSEMTYISGFDFQHYSMHDKSHSVAILWHIERILGRDRIELLNASDLWLLLEAAYSHDIGMSVTYEELCVIWKSEDFKEYIEKKLISSGYDDYKAFHFYKCMDEMIHNHSWTDMKAKEKWASMGSDVFDFELAEMLESPNWPVAFERFILLIHTDYIRKNHPEYSGHKIKKYAESEEREISSRMYHVLSRVVTIHGKYFEDIFKDVAYQENGFWSEQMHPQFVAAMLRIGDLLDMDSDRFNLRMMKHMGMIPMESMLHYDKHRSMIHLNFSDSGIQAIAKAENIEVCKTINEWFSWLDKEVEDLICSWNEIAPNQLKGCRMSRCRLKIYMKDEEFDANNYTKINIDPDRVYEMLIGDNIYRTELDFIREYIQNALDASKMRLWLEINDDDSIVTPYDLYAKGRGWFDKYQIEVVAVTDWDKGIIRFDIKDNGIGMEKKCIEALSNVVGDSWKAREDYASVISQMPSWLQPTGGFGIGVQSAFMMAQSVTFVTKSIKDNVGRKICLEGQARGGKVSEMSDTNAKYGTTVQVEIKIIDFMKAIGNTNGRAFSDNWLDRDELSHAIKKTLCQYIETTAQYSLLPIIVKCDKLEAKKIGMQWLYHADEIIRLIDKKHNLYVDGTEHEIAYGIDKKWLVLWDHTEGVLVKYNFEKQQGRGSCYYKGIHIHQEDVNTIDDYGIEIDYFGNKVKDILNVSRDKFVKNYTNRFNQDITKYRDIAVRLVALGIQENSSVPESFALDILLYSALHVVNIESDQIDFLYKMAPSSIIVHKFNPKNLNQYKSESIDFYFKLLGGDSKFETDNRALMSIILEKKDQDTRSVIEFIEKGDSILYVTNRNEGDRTGACAGPQNVIEEMVEQVRVNEKLSMASDYDILYPVVKEGKWIIDDRRIERCLDTYVKQHTRIDIKNPGKYYESIVCAHKKGIEEMKEKRYVEQIVDTELKIRLSQKVTNFPIIFGVTDKCEEAQWKSLWVSSLPLGSISINLERSYRENYFLIIPLTRNMVEILNREKDADEGHVNKERYEQIVLQKEEHSMLINWIYEFQISDERYSKKQIWKNCKELLELIYKTCYN